VPANSGSPFNIKSASLTMANFTQADVQELVGQHSAETSQRFTAAAVQRIYHWSQGQPFLVNALAGIATDDLLPDRSRSVQPAHIDEAKERLILARTTHLDSLAQRLRDPRVAAIVRSVLLGDEAERIEFASDNWELCVDLGLMRLGPGGAEAANTLYREVLARQLSYNIQASLPEPWWPWQRPDGGLDFQALADAFLAWWRENADILKDNDRSPYREAAAHLAFMGFLQRVVNSGGQVSREYAAARRRIDLLVRYGEDRFAVELKRVPPKHRSLDTVREEGVQQLAAYLDSLGLNQGWLIIFDQRPGRSWQDRMWRDDRQVGERTLFIRGA